MIVLSFLIWLIVVLILQAGFNGKSTTVNFRRNVTLYNLITDDELGSWLQDAPVNTTDLPLIGKHSRTSISPNLIDAYDKTDGKDGFQIHSSEENNPQLSDDPTQIEVPEDILEMLLSIPSYTVEPDWPVVLGNFDHYGDENWSNYLVQTEVPVLVRWYLTDAPESVFIYRIFKNKNGEEFVSDKPRENSRDFKVVIETGSWLLTHESTFRLGETFIENDLDGTDSKNTFFFSSPRLLVHNKIKENWKTTIVRHFDETGLNMTFIDRERMVVARRYLKRIR